MLSTTQLNLEVKADEKVILDLNGHTLNNDKIVDTATIIVRKGGSLTIKGQEVSAVTRTTTVENTSGKIYASIIDNYGELNLEGGNISPQINATYGIRNLSGATLNISGGRVSTIYADTYGIWNEGTANISDGQIDQSLYANYSAIVNKGDLNITGGKFKNLTGTDTVPTLAVVAGGEATITGGTFEYQDKSGIVKKQDVSLYIPEDYELDEKGNVIKKEIVTPPSSESGGSSSSPTEPESKPSDTDNNTDVKDDAQNTGRENPNTGDNTLISIVIGISGILYLTGYGVYCTRRKF